jgi:hypothetical protein
MTGRAQPAVTMRGAVVVLLTVFMTGLSGCFSDGVIPLYVEASNSTDAHINATLGVHWVFWDGATGSETLNVELPPYSSQYAFKFQPGEETPAHVRLTILLPDGRAEEEAWNLERDGIYFLDVRILERSIAFDISEAHV